MPMTISTFFYSYENISDEEIEHLTDFENEIDLSDFYVDPPELLVQQTIQAVLSQPKH